MAPKYDAFAHREGAWWAVEVPAVPGVFTQARRIDGVEMMARDAIAGVLDVDPGSFDIEVIIRMRPDWQAATEELAAVRAEAEAAEARASAKLREVAASLIAAGLPTRDVGAVLGISHQRVSQLLAGALADAAKAAPAKTPRKRVPQKV
jgi:predicted RNase H-like HicB family nuclease